MGEEATLAQAGSGNWYKSTQGQATRGNQVTNQSGRQQKSTPSAPGDLSRRNNNIFFDTQCKGFDGVRPDIGAFLDLRTEKGDKKVPFNTFRENILDYIVKEFDNANDSVDIIKTMIDPKIKW